MQAISQHKQRDGREDINPCSASVFLDLIIKVRSEVNIGQFLQLQFGTLMCFSVAGHPAGMYIFIQKSRQAGFDLVNIIFFWEEQVRKKCIVAVIGLQIIFS